MKKHLDNYKFDCKELRDNVMIFSYIDKIIFNFEDYDIDVHQIRDLTFHHNENIIIELAIFNPYLYNAFVSESKINTLTEYGRYLDINCENEYKYSVSYKNYKIKSASGSKEDQTWIYVLEPISE